jgi:hypothetical protein
LQFGGDWSYQGTVKITLDITQETKEIVLNVKEVKVKDAEIVTDHGKQESGVKTTDVSYKEEQHRVSLKFPDTIPTARNAILTINFTGTLNHDMSGFYRSEYKPAVSETTAYKDEDNTYMFSTQFESCDARRAFPWYTQRVLRQENAAADMSTASTSPISRLPSISRLRFLKTKSQSATCPRKRPKRAREMAGKWCHSNRRQR